MPKVNVPVVMAVLAKLKGDFNVYYQQAKKNDC